MRRLHRLFVLSGLIAVVAIAAKTPAPLDRAITDLAHNNGAAAEQDIIIARKQGANPALTHHLMAHAYLLQGDAVRALQEADPTQIPAGFATYATKIRIKADLLHGDLPAAQNELSQALAHAATDDTLWADLARLRAKTGDLAGAIAAGHRAAQLNPKSIDALLLAASLERDQNGLRAAIPWFNRVLAVDPKNIAALLELAATQGDSGEARAMLATTRRVLAIDHNNPQAFYLQAVMAARAGHAELARTLLYRTSPALDDLPGAILLRGLVEAQLGNTEQALSQFNTLLAAQPNNLRVRRLIGAVQARTGDDNGVIETLLPLVTRPDADSYALVTIARAYENVDQRDEAAKYLDRANAQARGASTPFDPGEPLGTLARSDQNTPNNADSAIPFMQGLILAGNTADAIGKAQNLATYNPGVPTAHILVGDAQLAAGHYAEAIAAYRRAAAINLTEPVVMRLLKALQLAGDTPGAVALLAQYRAQNPSNIAALQLTADLDIVQDHWPAAISKLETLRTRLGNSDANLLMTLALGYFNTGDPNRALVYARAAYALQPGNAGVNNSYGWLLFQTSLNHADGLALLEKAVVLAPANAPMRLQLGEAYLTRGRKDAARFALTPIAANPKLPEQLRAAQLLSHL